MQKALIILGQLTDLDVDWLANNGHKEHVPAGRDLITEGVPLDALYFVLDGRFAVYVAAFGEEPVDVVGVGEIAGEMSFVDARPPSGTVRAAEEAMVLAIPRARITAHLEADTGFAARFYKALAMLLSDRLRGKVEKREVRLDDLEEDVFADDELDADVLDTVAQGGERFDRILRRFRGG